MKQIFLRPNADGSVTSNVRALTFSAENLTTLVTIDFTGLGYSDYIKQLDIYVGNTREVDYRFSENTDILEVYLEEAHLKAGYLSIQPVAKKLISGVEYTKIKWSVVKIEISKSLNVLESDVSVDQTLGDYLQLQIYANDDDIASLETDKANVVDIYTKVELDGGQLDNRYYTETETNSLLSNKVDKITGKGLSTEDYTTAEKSKLNGIEALAEVNNISDVNATDLTDGGDTPLHTHKSIVNEVSVDNAKIETLNTGAKITRNIADDNSALIVNQANASSTGNILDLQFGGVSKLAADRFGQIAQEAWITPTLLNGWTSGTTPIQYMKDKFGFVHLRGRATSPGSAGAVFNLPVGYRLVNTQYFVGAVGSSATLFSRIDVITAVTCYVTTGFVDLSCVIFKAEA